MLVLAMRVPNPSPVLDEHCAALGPGLLSSTVAEVWRKAPGAFPHSNSVLDAFHSETVVWISVPQAVAIIIANGFLGNYKGLGPFLGKRNSSGFWFIGTEIPGRYNRACPNN